MTTSQEWAERLGWEEPTSGLTAPNPNRWLKEGSTVKNSQRALAAIKPVPEREQPLSEQYRLVAKQWADAENAAHILEELKTTTLEQRKCNLIEANPGIAENKAERMAKASPDWETYIREMCAARGKANLLKQQLEYIRMRHSEWQSAEANARSERRL